MPDPVQYVDHEPHEILAGGNGADGPGQDIVKQQRRNRELGQGAAHRLFDYAVHSSAHEHGAGLDVDGAHGVAEQHDRQHKPWSTFANDFFGITTHVVSRGGQVGKDDGGGAPKGDEGQHHRRGNEDLDRGTTLIRGRT